MKTEPYVEAAEGPDGEPILALVAGGAYQSATYLGKRRFEPVFAYHRAFDCMFQAGIDVRDVLMLGGGGYSYPKHFAIAHPACRMDVVEADPAVTCLAKERFFLQEVLDGLDDPDRLRLITAEGRAYLDSCPKTYDAIINDCFSGTRPARSLMTVEAARAVARCLTPDGLYLANAVSEREGCDVSILCAAASALAHVFAHVQMLPCSDEGFSAEDNYLLAASNRPFNLPGAIPFPEELRGCALHDERASAL